MSAIDQVGALRAPAGAARLHVGSEVGLLRRVVLHRPDQELRRLTPGNKDELLFDDVLWVKRARQEHDAFADALRDRGIDVLLAERPAGAGAGRRGRPAGVVGRSLAELELGPMVRPALEEWLVGLPGAELARILIGGVDVRGAAVPDAAVVGLSRRAARLRDPAAAQPHVHARHVLLDLRRRLHQSHGQAGAAAREPAPGGDLSRSPAVRRRAPQGVERPSRRAGVAGGRRRPRPRPRRAC